MRFAETRTAAQSGHLLAATAALTLAATACGGGAASSAPAVTTSAPAPATPAAQPSTVPTSAAPATTQASAPTTQAPAPGQGATGTIPYGTTATIQYDDFTSSDKQPLEVKVTVKAGTIEDLSKFKLDAQSKQGTPYYVAFEIANRGTRPLSATGFAGHTTVLTSTGDEAGRLTLLGSFPTCEGSPPDPLPVGASAKGCDVYIVPAGQTVTAVTVDSGSGELRWN